MVRMSLEKTYRSVGDIMKELERNSTKTSTLPFYKDLLKTLAMREKALSSVLESGRPHSPEQFAALKSFLEKYVILIDDLEKINGSLAKYILKMK